MIVTRCFLVAFYTCWLCFGIGCKSEKRVSYEVNNHANFDFMQKPSEIEHAVARCISSENPINLVRVTGHERFTPSKGGDGVKCTVTKVEPMFLGKQSIEIGQNIYLYPFMKSDSVIVLYHSRGNWVDASFYDKVQETIADKAKGPTKRKSLVDL